jgi:hypothetical protein
MITPPNLRQAIADYLYVEHNDDHGFALNLAAAHGIFDEELKRGLARILVTGQMDFGDFVGVTDNASMKHHEVIERLRKIWDSAFPGVDPGSVLHDSGVRPGPAADSE